MTLLASSFIIVKVMMNEIFNNRHVLDSLFEDLPKSEQTYFHFYGMTLVALLTDLIFKRFGINELDEGDKSTNQVKQELFTDLLGEDVSKATKTLYT